MDFEIRPLTDGFGAEVIGLDLGALLPDEDFDRLRRAWFEAGVMVVRDQHLTPDQQVAFSRRFGPLIIHVMDQFLLPGHPEILLISNKKRDDGTPMGLGRRALLAFGCVLWGGTGAGIAAVRRRDPAGRRGHHVRRHAARFRKPAR